MSKLVKLKEWLLLDEAAAYISEAVGETIAVADLYRFALDGHLRLSVNFVSRCRVRRGKKVGRDLARYCMVLGVSPDKLGDQKLEYTTDKDFLIECEKLALKIDKDNPVILPDQSLVSYLEELKVQKLEDIKDKGRPSERIKSGGKIDEDVLFERMKLEVKIDEDFSVILDQPLESIDGVWDLAMFGGEVLDIKQHYYAMTSGVEITSSNIDGPFVEKDGVFCQILERFTDEDLEQIKSVRHDEKENKNKSNDLGEKKCEEGINLSVQESVAAFIAERSKTKYRREEAEKYYPADRLPEDSVLVVRIEEMKRFIQSLEDTSEPKQLHPKERISLLVMIGALLKNQNIDTTTRGITSSIVKMTENLGAPLTDDTIRKILRQVEDAVESRQK